MIKRSRVRWAWWALAYASLGLGFLGIVVPFLPTVPFIMLSAYAAARGSERLHRWLLAHPQFGPMITDWQEHGAISRPAKWAAAISMAVCAVILLVFAPVRWAAYAGVAFMTCVGTWVWLRPEPESGTDDGSPGH